MFNRFFHEIQKCFMSYFHEISKCLIYFFTKFKNVLYQINARYDSVDDIIEHFTRLNDDDILIIYNIIDKAMNSFYIDMNIFD